jgi:hypothetical protein
LEELSQFTCKMPFAEFLQHQVSLMFNTQASHAKRTYDKSHAQSIVVSASSLCYLYPAVVCYTKSDDSIWFHVGSYLYVCVALASMAADGSLLEPPWFPGASPASRWQIVDRWVAVSGGLYAGLNVYHRDHTLSTYGMIAVAGLAALGTLRWARKMPDHSVWKWVGLQSLWHILSSCWIVYLVTRH